MFKPLLVSLFCMLALFPRPAISDIHPDFDKLKHSITTVENHKWICTAWSPGIARLITASHCVNDEVGYAELKTAHGANTRVIKLDKQHDIALLETEETMPPLELGPKPKLGDRVWQVGYGETGAGPHVLFFYLLPSYIQALKGETPLYNFHDMNTMAGNSFAGMSGGPIVDDNGKVVSSVIGGAPHDSDFGIIGNGSEYDALKKFFQTK